MANVSKLTDRDILEGKNIADLFSTLSEESKSQCLIYIMALRDKELIDKSKNGGNANSE